MCLQLMSFIEEEFIIGIFIVGVLLNLTKKFTHTIFNILKSENLKVKYIGI